MHSKRCKQHIQVNSLNFGREQMCCEILMLLRRENFFVFFGKKFFFFTHTNTHMHIKTMSKIRITRTEMIQWIVVRINDIEIQRGKCHSMAQSMHVLATLTLCRSCNIFLFLVDLSTLLFHSCAKSKYSKAKQNLKCTKSAMVLWRIQNF